MSKNTVSSFGLENRIPVKETVKTVPVETVTARTSEVIPDIKLDNVQETRTNSIIEVEDSDEDKDFIREKRTKRVNLLVAPTNYKKLRKYLNKRNQSFNDFICTYIDEVVKEKGL